METFGLGRMLAIAMPLIGLVWLFWWILRPNSSTPKPACPACAGEGQLLQQEIVDSEDEGLSIEKRMTYYCSCGNVWSIWDREVQLIRVSGFNPKMN